MKLRLLKNANEIPRVNIGTCVPLTACASLIFENFGGAESRAEVGRRSRPHGAQPPPSHPALGHPYASKRHRLSTGAVL